MRWTLSLVISLVVTAVFGAQQVLLKPDTQDTMRNKINANFAEVYPGAVSNISASVASNSFLSKTGGVVSGAVMLPSLRLVYAGGTNVIAASGTNVTVNGYRVWTAGNDGQTSGLDADTLWGYTPETLPVQPTVAAGISNAQATADGAAGQAALGVADAATAQAAADLAKDTADGASGTAADAWNIATGAAALAQVAKDEASNALAVAESLEGGDITRWSDYPALGTVNVAGKRLDNVGAMVFVTGMVPVVDFAMWVPDMSGRLLYYDGGGTRTMLHTGNFSTSGLASTLSTMQSTLSTATDNLAVVERNYLSRTDASNSVLLASSWFSSTNHGPKFGAPVAGGPPGGITQSNNDVMITFSDKAWNIGGDGRLRFWTGLFGPAITFWSDNNDGSGSGLDADTVDGYHAGELLPALTASNSFLNKVSGTDTTAPFSVRGYSGSQSVIIPVEGTYFGMAFKHRLAFGAPVGAAGGMFYSTNESGSVLEGLVWRKDNDGSGSGLDADLLDGFHQSDLPPNALASNRFLGVAGGTSSGDLRITNASLRIVGDGTNGLRMAAQAAVSAFSKPVYFQTANGAGVIAEQQVYADYQNPVLRRADGLGNVGTMWDSLSDGPGSGLDADTVDGFHASAFAPAAIYQPNMGAGTPGVRQVAFATRTNSSGAGIMSYDTGQSFASAALGLTATAPTDYGFIFSPLGGAARWERNIPTNMLTNAVGRLGLTGAGWSASPAVQNPNVGGFTVTNTVGVEIKTGSTRASTVTSDGTSLRWGSATVYDSDNIPSSFLTISAGNASYWRITTPPATPDSPGEAGMIAIDGVYFYWYNATLSKWIRTTGSSTW